MNFHLKRSSPILMNNILWLSAHNSSISVVVWITLPQICMLRHNHSCFDIKSGILGGDWMTGCSPQEWISISKKHQGADSFSYHVWMMDTSKSYDLWNSKKALIQCEIYLNIPDSYHGAPGTTGIFCLTGIVSMIQNEPLWLLELF